MSVLELDDLSVRYDADDGDVHAVDGVSFEVREGETFGLVGESGSGKSTLGRGLLHLLDANGYVADGSVWFDGTLPGWEGEDGDPHPEYVEGDYPVRDDGMTDLTRLDDAQIREIRWRNVALVPQNAMNALNPVYRVGDQIVEAVLAHEPRTTRAEADDRARELLERVGIDPARADDYAHQFSGGMKQRAVIAMAMACNPDLLVADEPTTALDVIVQDRILEELAELQAEFGVAMLFISHDVSVMSDVCDRIGVMYGGKLMEVGTKREVLDGTANPYTLGLKNAFPRVTGEQERLVSIPGSPPTLDSPADACRFVDRCPFAVGECRTDHPPTYDVAAAEGGRRAEATENRGHRSACYRVDELETLRSEAADEETWTGDGSASEDEPEVTR